MGNFLPFLQELANFIQRCYSVVRNTVNQFACLYHEKQKLYASTFKDVRLDGVWDTLGSLLSVLVTLDAVVQGMCARMCVKP